MRKKLLLFIIAAIFTFSSMTVLAAEDTADKDAKDKKSAAATIDTSLYYYNNFDNDAYRDAYNQLKKQQMHFTIQTRMRNTKMRIPKTATIKHFRSMLQAKHGKLSVR